MYDVKSVRVRNAPTRMIAFVLALILGLFSNNSIILVNAAETDEEYVTITFDLDGGTTSGATDAEGRAVWTRPKTNSTFIFNADFTKEGYYFYGFIDTDTNERYTPKVDYMGAATFTRDTNLKVLWCKNDEVPILFYSDEAPNPYNKYGYKLLETQFVKKGEKVTSYKIAERYTDGIYHELQGWYDYRDEPIFDSYNTSYYSRVFDFNTSVTEHKRFFPVYKKIVRCFVDVNGGTVQGYSSFTVTFNANLENGVRGTLRSYVAKKTGSTFVGWKVTTEGKVFNLSGVDQYNKVVASNASLHIKEGATFKAVWNDKYTVTFDSAGGSAVDSQTVTGGNKASKPVNPTKLGYIFDAWYTEDGEKFDFTSQITENTSLVAHWEKGCTVTFDSDGGSEVNPQTVEKGQTTTKPTDPTKENSVFAGWYTEEGEEFNFSDAVNQDITLTAHWIKEYTVTFDSDGGSSVSSQKVEAGKTASKPNSNPTKSDYTFDDWYTESGEVFNFDTPITEDIILYARWLQSCIVGFNSNGGSSVEPQTVIQGETATRPEDPTKEGYKFDNWYTEEDEVFNFNTPITENTILYAGWLQSYTVDFNSNGGSPVESQTVIQGEKATRPEDPTKEDYKFTGWYTDYSCTEKFDFSTPIMDYVSLVAGWEPDGSTEPDTPVIIVGNTITTFEVDNEIMDEDKPEDVLGGDLIVSVPAELKLAYTSDGKTFTKEDTVYAVGRVHSSDYLKVITPTNIEYTADDATEELLTNNPEARVPGVISFGDTEEGNQASKWLASELLTGVGKTSVIEGTGRTIRSTVQKSDITFIGSYSSIIDYNITLYQPNINRRVITEDLSQYEDNRKILTKEELKQLVETNAEPIEAADLAI